MHERWTIAINDPSVCQFVCCPGLHAFAVQTRLNTSRSLRFLERTEHKTGAVLTKITLATCTLLCLTILRPFDLDAVLCVQGSNQARSDSVHSNRLDPCCADSSRLSRLWRKLSTQSVYQSATQVAYWFTSSPAFVAFYKFCGILSVLTCVFINWSCCAGQSTVSDRVPSLSCHVRETVHPTHYTNCRLSITLRKI